MRLAHFHAFAPVCPLCARAGSPPALALGHVGARTETEIIDATLCCPSCRHEYPILDGLPVIVADVAGLLAQRGVELLVRDALDPVLESLFGDAIGPDSWFDTLRQMQSTYGWDGYGDLDPEPAPAPPEPGAARRCLARLLQLCGPEVFRTGGVGATAGAARILDLGCAAGRTSFDLAAAAPGALVLGLDMHLGLLRLARGALAGEVSYPRRRIGLVYDRRRFAVQLDGGPRVDFWACDAAALPLRPGIADLCVALNLLDCTPDPRALLESLARVCDVGARILLATPYDWSTRATPLTAWLGGHSQRAEHRGAGEAFLHALLAGAGTHAIPGLAVLAEEAAWPWHTRLHERSFVAYRTHLLALARQ
jgi:SAM-dependent methyltransferase/uncharacterized protein YbaR (Trm112 family)